MKLILLFLFIVLSCQNPQYFKKIEQQIDDNKNQVSQLLEQNAILSSEVESLDYRIKNQQRRIENLSKVTDKNTEHEISSKKNINIIKEGRKDANQITTKQVLLNFDSSTKQIDLSEYISSQGVYMIDLKSINDIIWETNSQAEYRLNISSKIQSKNDQFDYSGLVSYYQYQFPEKGIQNMVTNPLLINVKNPFIFIEGNDKSGISGTMLLWISGYY